MPAWDARPERCPTTIDGMAAHLLAFTDALGLTQIDLLGFSLGGMVAQKVALERPALVRRMLLVGTAPAGGEDIMHLEKPELRKILEDPNLVGSADSGEALLYPERVESGSRPGLRDAARRHAPKIGSPCRARASRRRR